MLKVHSIQTLRNCQGPGNRLVIFLQGCNFRCISCPNPDTQSLNRKSENINLKEIITKLEELKIKFGENCGLTISGGEPTLQTQATFDLFKLTQKLGIHTALDTNCYLTSEKIHTLYTYTDLLIVDFKHINNEWHQKITGKSNVSILKNLEFRQTQNKDLWLRYNLIPNYSDQETSLHQFGRHFQDYTIIKRLEILPYHIQGAYKYRKLGLKYKLSGIKSPTEQSIDKTKSIFEKYFSHVVIQ